MSAPNIQGQAFPDYRFREFPKVTRRDSETRIVNNPTEEAAAAADGFHAPKASAEQFNGADPAAFDHDKDGKPGGSKPRRQKKS